LGIPAGAGRGQTLDLLAAELLRHSGRQLHDDMAMLLVERVYCGTCTRG
jgi:hypothetical protein